MKSQELKLLQWLLQDLERWCNTSTTFDYRTVERRVEHEGFSFLTITLPDFCKDFERCLDREQVLTSDFSSFEKSGRLPKFLSGFTENVFCKQTGKILDVPSVDCIFAVRQITLLYSKVRLSCSDKRVDAAFKKYVQTDTEVEEVNDFIRFNPNEGFIRACRLLFRPLFSKIESDLFHASDQPRHGPGATADKLVSNEKYSQRVWPLRLQEVFPFEDYLLPSPRFISEAMDEVTFVPPDLEQPSKVVQVPKTLRTPRIIAIEPTCTQYVQQGLMEMIVGGIRRDRTLRHLIGFDDQVPNQELARLGSLYGKLATLDLSEASDRVPNELVKLLFADHPYLSKAVQACRSFKAHGPGFEINSLAKFASMGSALCFPVEAMCFTALIFDGIAKSRGVPVTRRLIREAIGQVRVYGDDLIVPVDCVNSVVSSLENFGFQVNERKSFWNSHFRESCGKEYYHGNDVSVVRVREVLPARLSDHTSVISLVEFRNLSYERGLWHLASKIDEWLVKVLRHYPVIHRGSQALGRVSFLPYEGERVCPNLQRDLVRARVVSVNTPINELDGSGALLKFFLKRGDEPLSRDHLRRSGRAVAVRTRLRWVTPY